MVKIIVIEPSKEPEVRELKEISLKAMQEIVEGYIEVIGFDRDTLLVINEEGKLRNLPLNFQIRHHTIVGTVFICGKQGEDMIGLTESQIKESLKRLKTVLFFG